MNDRDSGNIDSLRIQLLGPVRAWKGSREAHLGSAQQKGLLGLLALAAGQPLPRHELVAAMWGENPPVTSANIIQSYVSRLRRTLEPGRSARSPSALLPAVGDGYALMVDPDAVDVLRFRRALNEAAVARRDGDHEKVRALLQPSLAAWQSPLSDAAFFADQRTTASLFEQRWTAVGWHAEATIACGDAAEVISPLQDAAVVRPLDERLQALLIRALRTLDRRADAFDVYRRARHRLNDALGIDPGPDLAAAYESLLAEEPSVVDLGRMAVEPVGPAQLPGRTSLFTGRADELSTMHQHLTRNVDRMQVVCLEGTGGVGKTALAVELGHQMVAHYSDGQLFLDLRGHDAANAMSPHHALVHMLRSLGLDESRLPSDIAELSAHYRTAVSGKRLLIVLDNAIGTEQILPLMPATPSCGVIVTSRRSLAALTTHHLVHRYTIDVLPAGEALSLLERVLGDSRVAVDPQAAATLADLCGRLPLALRIAAARLSIDAQRPLAGMVAELANEHERLAGLTVEEESRSVRGTFSWSYHALAKPEARVFRLLSVHPGTTFCVDLVAATTNHTIEAARQLVGRLSAAHLLSEVGDGRYRFHDLIRLYAMELLANEEPTGRRRADAEQRLLDWYLDIAGGSNRVVNPLNDLVVLPEPQRPLPFPPDPRAALDYLTAEADNLPPVVRHAALRGHSAVAWRLAYLLFSFYLARTRPADFAECARWGLQAAESLGDRRIHAIMLNVAGVAATIAHHEDESAEYHRQQIRIWQELDEGMREAAAWSNLGLAYAWKNKHREALAAYQHALALATSNGETVRMAIMLDNIGDTARNLGDLTLSRQSLEKALTIWRGADNPQGQGQALFGLAKTQFFDGDTAAALGLLDQALAQQQGVGDHRMAALTTHWIAKIRCHSDGAATGRALLERALNLYRELRDEHGESAILTALATAHLHSDDCATAHELLRQAQVLRTRVPDPLEEGMLHHGIGSLAARMGDDLRAATQFARASKKFVEAGCIESTTMLNLMRAGIPGDVIPTV